MQRGRTIEAMLDAARVRMLRFTPEQAFAAMQAGALLIDTRCAELRRADGFVPGSVHVPLSVLYWRLDPSSPHRDTALADRTRRVILLCAHGFSSSLAAATLLELGDRHASDVIGGFEAWAASGLPVVGASS